VPIFPAVTAQIACCPVCAEMGSATRLKVVVEAPTTTHELTVGKSQAWLDSNGKSPREQSLKVTLRQMLGRTWSEDAMRNAMRRVTDIHAR